ISFRLTNDKKQLFVSNGNDSVTNILGQIYGVQVAKSLIYFEAKNRDYQISGYTTNPIINRSSRNYINVVVNNRIIQNKDIVNAFVDSYDQLIPKNRYPVAIIYIEVDPLLIDVNIHPRKQEIKFSENEKLVSLIKKTLRDKLEVTQIYQKPTSDYSQTKISFYEEQTQKQETLNLVEEETANYNETEDVKKIIPDMEYIGQYSGTYLIFQNEKGLFLLDQHAAAERIRYERYLKKWSEFNQETQMLITPLVLELSNDILIQLPNYLDKIKSLGIGLELKENYVIVKEIPNWFPKNYEEIYVEALIMDLLDETQVDQTSLIDDLAKLLACKHSLKANHYISNIEANQLLNDLRKCDRPYTCPHGRPVIVDISHRQIEYWFNRVL
ncbi:MAG: hypothetical protein AB7U52_06575, partial [Candidatus Izemoplasmatales bacterium]